MADAFLDSDLVLDIRSALQQVDRLNEAVHRATTDVRVTVDARQVATAINAAISAADTTVEVTTDGARITRAVTGAVDAADAEVQITGDARSITAAIDGAVDAADTMVEIAADAGRVTGAIDAAVSAADTRVDVDGSVSPGLNTDVLNLGANLADAKDEAGGLGKLLAGFSAAAAAGGLFMLADAASELEQSIGGTEAVFGEAADTVSNFAQTADSMAGLTETAARTLTSQIGGLLKGFGFTKKEAAATSVVLAQLGADLAATFGGSPQEAVEALGGALRGEFNPLERFGVSLNVAQINAYALANGMAASEKEVTIAVRAQAALALIMERTADAQGQFNRELETAGGVMSVARAQFGDLAAEAGQLLLPGLIALVSELTDEVGPGLMELAEAILPSVSAAIENLAPLLGVAVDLLVLMSPAIAAVGDALAAIPDEVITIGATMLIANKAVGAATGLFQGLGGALKIVPQLLAGTAQALPGAAANVGPLAGGITKLATSLGALGPAGAIAIAVGGGLTAAWLQSREEARRFQEEVDQLTASLEEIDGQTQLTTAGIAKYVLEQSRINAKDQIDDLGRLGLTFTQLADLAQQGAAGEKVFHDTLLASGEVMEVFAGQGNTLVDATGKVVGDLGAMSTEFGKVMRVGDQMLVGNTDLITSYDELARVTEETSKTQLDMLVAQGLITEEQRDAALQLDRNGEATRTYAAALNTLEPQIVAAAEAEAKALAAGEEAAAMYLGLGEAIRSLSEENPDLAGPLVYLQAQKEPSEATFLAVAQAIDKAALSEEDMASMALVLGTDVETLTGFVETATEALADFADTAIGNLPTVSDAFSNLGEDGVLSAREFRDALTLQTTVMRDFQRNLRTLTEGGFADLAGIIAEQGPEVGGALAGEMAQALEDGHTEVLETTRETVDTFNATWEDTTAYLRDNLGPEFILTTGLIGSAATTAFGENLDLGERLRIANDIAELEMDEGGKAVAALAATAGEDTAREYGEALDLDQKTIDAAVLAGEAIKANAPVRQAAEAGVSVGHALGDGLIWGMQERIDQIGRTAADWIHDAADAALLAADARSPSRLFAKIGGYLGEGLALGMANSVPGVTRATREVVSSMAGVVADTRMPSLGGVTADVGSFGGAGGARVLTLGDIDAVARVVAQAMPESLARDIVLNGVDLSDAGQSVSRELQSLANRMP